MHRRLHSERGSRALTRVLLLLAFLSWHVAEGSNLTGTVAGQSTGLINGARVTIFFADGKGYRASTAAGRFAVSAVPDGDYFLMIEADGHASVFGAVHLDGHISHEIAVVMLPLDSKKTEFVGAAGRIAEPASPKLSDRPHKVTSAKLSKQVKPSYPVAERNRRGVVKIATTLRIDGTLDDLVVLSTLGQQLALSALAAVRQWRYTPTLVDGEPVEVSFTIDVNF